MHYLPSGLINLPNLETIDTLYIMEKALMSLKCLQTCSLEFSDLYLYILCK